MHKSEPYAVCISKYQRILLSAQCTTGREAENPNNLSFQHWTDCDRLVLGLLLVRYKVLVTVFWNIMNALFLNNCEIPSNATFLLGVSSVGNVGQLAVDSILCSLSSKKLLSYIGCLETDFVLPMTGCEYLAYYMGILVELTMGSDERLDKNSAVRLCMPIEGMVHITSRYFALICVIYSVQSE